jgi:thiol-disulfide isomerase/thioredoxin
VAVAILLLGAGGEPALDFETLAGERVRVTLEESDAALVVHFWATWCPECTDELPALDRAATRCASGRVRVVAVNVGEDSGVVERFLGERPLRLPVLRDPEGDVWRRAVGRGLPANLVVTREGRRTELGPRVAQGWEERLAGLGCAPGTGAEGSPSDSRDQRQTR